MHRVCMRGTFAHEFAVPTARAGQINVAIDATQMVVVAVGNESRYLHGTTWIMRCGSGRVESGIRHIRLVEVVCMTVALAGWPAGSMRGSRILGTVCGLSQVAAIAFDGKRDIDMPFGKGIAGFVFALAE